MRPGAQWTAYFLLRCAAVALCLRNARGASDSVITGPVFEPAESSSVDVTSSTFETEFNDGSALTGTLASDTVRIGLLNSVKSAAFGLGDANVAVGRWHHSGILGLGVQSTGAGIPPLLESMLPRADDRRFAVALDLDGGGLWMGSAASNSVALGVTNEEPVLQPGVPTEYNDYMVEVHSIALGAEDLPLRASGAGAGAYPALVDTGASAIVLPKVAFDRFQSALSTHADPLPAITVAIGGRTYAIPAEQFNLPDIGVAVTTDEAQPHFFALGAPFLRTVFALFDASRLPPQVGFAERVQSVSATGRRRATEMGQQTEDQRKFPGAVQLLASEVDTQLQRTGFNNRRRRRLQGTTDVNLESLESLQYFVPVSVGTPLQGPFLLQLDTGSGLMVVMAKIPQFPFIIATAVALAIVVVLALVWGRSRGSDLQGATTDSTASEVAGVSREQGLEAAAVP